MKTDVTHPSPRSYCSARTWPSKVTHVAREPMVTRNFRVSEIKWEAVKARAEKTDYLLSDFLRDCVDWREADPQLWEDVEAEAARRGETMRAVVLRQLRAYLD